MIVTADYIDKIYDEIKREKTASSDKGVLIFASGTHADSVCAAQQLLVGCASVDETNLSIHHTSLHCCKDRWL